MEKNERLSETHVMVLPYHSQGHINPMLQFAKRLASKGLKLSFLLTTGPIFNSMDAQSGSIDVEIICEGLERRQREEESREEYLERYRRIASQGLAELIDRHSRTSHPAKILVYDSFLPWALEVAEPLGVDGVPFFTQSCAVSAIYYHLYEGKFNFSPSEELSSEVSIPSMPILCGNDLPSFFNHDKAVLSFVVKQFSGFKRVKWVLFNTFDKLEEEIIKWMRTQGRIKTIGPTVPLNYLGKGWEDDKDYGLNLFKQNVDTCTSWLDSKAIGSVVYVSFGSMVSLGEEQMEELACGLKTSNSHFLWVVRESETKALPINFAEETSEKGLVVSWCSQLEVLAHKAVGCFLTHSGWNSTIEAVSLGVPLIAMPHFSDQATNAKFVEDVWRVGVRVKADEKGIVKREELEVCIRETMEGERGKEVKKNALRLKELAKEAVNEGGSSDSNIQEFVAEILCQEF